MTIPKVNEATDVSAGRNDSPQAAPATPASRFRASMSCGMGKNSMSLIMAVFVGVALGALLFGGAGGIAGATQLGSWTFLLFLLPCLLMVGAMMMMANKSGPNGGL
ncbi:MAG: hypothetical protein K2Y56_24375 [Methylobacterium sp.]|uniref:hypothetical protein n=1 Tax=Methylobacterium sp. TaxID=409 RepID=UPI0025D073D8|nr:hypothetical protein [Methylobacterium sp.]MBX9934611.1 hypothetical protein [Methylobacterium sp.]